MRLVLALLLTCAGMSALAADRIPLADFLRDVRLQLYNLQLQENDQTAPVAISNLHVEMHVIAEKDSNGNTAYFVLEGQAAPADVVTQKLSFDLALQPGRAAAVHSRGHRSYSTRSRGNGHGSDRYPPQRHYPEYPYPYVQEIHPVILFGKDR